MRLLPIIGVLILVVSTGCVGVEEFESDRPTVDQSTLGETSYEETGNETFRIEESRDILGEERGATIVSHIATYEKSSEDLELNLSDDQIESQLQNIGTERLVRSQSQDVVSLVGEDDIIDGIAMENNRFTESQIKTTLNLTGQTISQFADSNDINLTEYADRQDVINSTDNDQLKTIVRSSSYDESGSVYAVLSTPSAGVLGTELNPLVLAPSEELVNRVGERASQSVELGELERTERINNTQGHIIEIEQYVGTINNEEGVDVDAKILLARNPSYDQSVLISVGVYPEFVDERDSLIEMIRNTEVKDN